MTIPERMSDWYWNLSLRRRRTVRVLMWLVILAIPVYVFLMPLKSVPLKTPIAEDSPSAVAASELFWEVFHDDEISRSAEVAQALTSAYDALEEPSVDLTSLLAGIHLWRWSSRNRLGLSRDQIRTELEASLRYGERAAALDAGSGNPKTTAPSIAAMAEWLIRVDDDQTDSLPAIHIDILENSIVWPPFAGYMQGYLLAPMYTHDSPYYASAMVGYRFMLDECAGFKLPKVMHFTKIAHTLYGFKSLFAPVCYNNPVAPHSIEGTLLSVADTYLKGGDLDNARLWYENVKTSPTYATWQYQDVLDGRLASLEELRDKFRRDTGRIEVQEPAMVLQSEIACGMCHTR